MVQGENGATGSTAVRQMAWRGSTSTQREGECMGPAAEGEHEQIKESLSKPASRSLTWHSPTGSANPAGGLDDP